MALQVTQVKSANGAKANQLATLQTLGLRRMRHTVVVPDRPEFRGMVATINHLVAVEEVPDGTTVGAAATRQLSASDAGQTGAVGEVTSVAEKTEAMLDEQGHLGQGIDNPTDVVQLPRQKNPDDANIKVSGGPAMDDPADDSAPAPSPEIDTEE